MHLPGDPLLLSDRAKGGSRSLTSRLIACTLRLTSASGGQEGAVLPQWRQKHVVAVEHELSEVVLDRI